MKALYAIVIAAFAGVFLFDSLALPLMPDSVFRFLQRAFELDGWTQVVLFNDLFGLFAGLYFVGLVEAVRAFVLPREEGFLSLILSKPISRGRYVWMQFSPIVTSLFVMGSLSSVLLTAKLAWLNGLSGLSFGSVVAMGLTATLLAIGVSSLAAIVCVMAKDTYTATLLGFLVFSAVVIPAGGYLYRPDLYSGHASAKALLVFPANVIWHQGTLLELFPRLVFAVLLCIAMAFVLSITWLVRRDVD